MRLFPWILAALAVGVYAVTVLNGYVLDDRMVLTEHPYVQQGIEGIPAIMTTDSFVGMYEAQGTENQMTGGRYRPLAQVTYALEIEAFGKPKEELSTDEERQGIIREQAEGERICEPWIPHAVNVVLYMLVVLAGYAFLRRLVPDDAWVAFLAMGLFAVHPVHVEVVANIKSRDELLSLLFILLALRAAGRSVFWCTVCTVLALLSKEYAVILLVLVPLLMWVERGWSVGRFVAQFVGVALAVAGYVALRLSVVPFRLQPSPDPMVEPYARAANVVEALCTKCWVLLLDLKLLVFPYPLQYSYAFEQVPYVGTTHPGFWASVVVFCLLIVAAITLLARRQRVVVLVVFFLLSLFLVSNLVLSTSNMMAERLLFHASFAFCGVLAWGMVRLGSNFLYAVFFWLLLVGGAWSVVRSMDWRSEHRLFLADAEKAPDCSLIQLNAGAIWAHGQREAIREGAPEFVIKDHEEKALRYLSRAVQKSPDDPMTHLNLGRVHRVMGRLDEANGHLLAASATMGNSASLQESQRLLAAQLVERAVAQGRNNDHMEAYNSLRKALNHDPENDAAHYYFTGAKESLGQYDDAREYRKTFRVPVWRGWYEPAPGTKPIEEPLLPTAEPVRPFPQFRP